MKFSLFAFASLVPVASAARGFKELSEMAGKLNQHTHDRKLQLSEQYTFNNWGEGGVGLLDGTPHGVLTDAPDGTAAPTEEMLPGLYDIIANSSDHTTLLSALGTSYLDELLANFTGEATVFAPTNDAFAAVANESAIYFRPEYVLHLIDILLYHFVEGKIMSTDLVETNITMANDESANITVDPAPMINDANIIAADIEASNGVLHSIDAVLTPEWLYYDCSDIITYIPELFSTLGDLLDMANLTDALAGEGPFTVFAPMDSAFNMSADAVNAIMESDDPIAALTEVLYFHVAPYVVTSDMIEDGAEITMLNGETATIRIEPIYANATETTVVDGEDVAVQAEEREIIDMWYYLNDVLIIAGDFYTSNGVVHILYDGILTPGSMM